MANELTIEIQGLQEVQKKLEDIAYEVGKSGNLVAKAGYIIERQAKKNWGHAQGKKGHRTGGHQGGFPNVDTGRLRASITVQLDSPTQARVGTNVEYAPAVEYGHQLRGRVWTSGIRYTKGGITAMSNRMSPAYPFLGPTIEQTKGEIDGVAVSFGNDLEEIWNA